MIIVLDNRDSFVFNLARYFRLLGCPVEVLCSHTTSLDEIAAREPTGIVISPGPCTPAEAGCSVACVQRFRGILHDGTNLFAGIPSPVRACRYHSLVAEESSVPAGLTVTARTADGVVMAVANEAEHLYGVQFHPESILTEYGFRLLANFLEHAGRAVDSRLVDQFDADVVRQAGKANKADDDGHTRVVTF
jgi:anthranilate/para-aminobenzoate synthase component II